MRSLFPSEAASCCHKGLKYLHVNVQGEISTEIQTHIHIHIRTYGHTLAWHVTAVASVTLLYATYA